MRILLIFLGLCTAQGLVATTELYKQLEAAAEKGDLSAMKLLLAKGASCTPTALSRFFQAIASKQQPIPDQAVDVATHLFPRILPGINGKSAINQSSCMNFMKGKKCIGYKHYLPLTWIVEHYECKGNAEKIASLLIKHGADIENPLVCPSQSEFKGWITYLAKHQAANAVLPAPAAGSAAQK